MGWHTWDQIIGIPDTQTRTHAHTHMHALTHTCAYTLMHAGTHKYTRTVYLDLQGDIYTQQGRYRVGVLQYLPGPNLDV